MVTKLPRIDKKKVVSLLNKLLKQAKGMGNFLPKANREKFIREFMEGKIGLGFNPNNNRFVFIDYHLTTLEKT